MRLRIKRFLQIIILVPPPFITLGQDSVKVYKTELGIATGYVYPELKKMNIMEDAEPKRGRYFALNLNYDLWRINKRVTVLTGARVTYFDFKSIERDDHYFFPSFGTRDATHGALSMGIPFRFKYAYPVLKQTEVHLGVGLIPCVQSQERYEWWFAGRLYGEAFVGFNIGPVMLALQVTRLLFIGHPYSRLLPEYYITTGALDVRYRMLRTSTKNVKLRPKTHP